MVEGRFRDRIQKCHLTEECVIDITDLLRSDASSQCTDNAYIFVQLPCHINNSDKNQREIFGLMTGCLAVFVYLYTLVYFDYIKTVETNKYVDWDVKTITAGDYTVEFDLDPDTYEHWKENYYDETSLLNECA